MKIRPMAGWMAVAMLLMAGVVRGETVYWTGASDTDWANSGNWTNTAGVAALPGPDTHVVINGGTNQPTLDLSGGAATIASLTIGTTTASTLTFANGNVTDQGLVVTNNATIGVSATLSHEQNGTTANGETHRLYLRIGGALTVDAGGTIQVSGKGYNAGQGLGGSTASNTGGGHGGEGGNGGGTTYGEVTAPILSGSGGNSGRGGGVIRLDVAGDATIDGELLADGGNGGGAGAGGSIYLNARSVSGGGTIRAKGGDTTTGWTGGGGGRVAIMLDAGTTFGTLTISARSGSGGANRQGGPGTLFKKTSEDRVVLIDGVGTTISPAVTIAATTIPAGLTWENFDRLILTNLAHLKIPATSTLRIPAPSDIQGDSVNARITLDGSIEADAVITHFDCATLTLYDRGTINVSKDLTISNFTYVVTATEKIESGNIVVASNGVFSTMIPDRGALALNSLRVQGGGTVRHEVNGATVEDYKLVLNIAEHLTVDANGRLDVAGRGLSQGAGRPSSAQSGASHGGVGGADTEATSAGTYGSITNPVTCGSGSGGRGAGAIILTVTGAVTNNGVISASAGASGNGPGSGGSVFIQAVTLAGSGSISANGADSSNGWNGSGGGRIAVVLTAGTDFGANTFTAYGGTTRRRGAAGAIYLKPAGQAHGTLRIDNNNSNPTYDYITTRIDAAVTDTLVGDVVMRRSGRLELAVDQGLSVYGSWSNAATFVANSGSAVTLAGDAPATLWGDSTFANLACEAPGKTLAFEVGKPQTLLEGLTLRGADGDPLLLVSTVPGTAWLLSQNVEHNIEYVAVSDSDASVGSAVTARNSTDGGGNVNWIFANPAPIVWTGVENSQWNEPLNWVPQRLPLADDPIVTVAGAPVNQPILDIARTLNGYLVIESGATLTLAGNNLTVGGSVTNAGSLVASAAETISIGGHANFTAGTFTAAQSTVILNGAASQSLTAAGNTFHKLTVANGAGTVTFTDGFMAGEFSCVVPGASMTFENNALYAVERLKLIGTVGAPILLRSSADGTAWRLLLSEWQHVRYVDVRDSDASDGRTVYAMASTSSGNNDNWDFGAWSIWTGALSDDFSSAGNWSPEGAPGPASRILIDGDGANAPRLSQAVTIQRLTVGENAASTLIVNTNLTVTADVLLMDQAVLTHDINSSAPLKRVVLDVGRDLTMLSGATVNVNAKGYTGGPGYPPSPSNNGASHGGQGGAESVAARAPTYGSVIAPVLPGSGSIGPGGGAVILSVAGMTILDGLITANGGSHAAGGAVLVTTGTLRGSATIRANGGDSESNWNGGGGGRIAIVVTNGTNAADLTVTAYGGTTRGRGAAGTIYIRTVNDDGHGTLTVDNNGLDTYVYITPGAPGASTLIGPLVEDAVTGNVMLKNAGKLEVASNETLTVYRDWDNDGVFIPVTNGTVTFTGAAPATILGDNTWGNLTIATAGKTVAFEAGKTQTIVGTPTFENVVWLLSTVPGLPWYLVKPGGAGDEQPVGAVVVQDSDASAGITFVAGLGSASLGNNRNWRFPPRGSLLTVR